MLLTLHLEIVHRAYCVHFRTIEKQVNNVPPQRGSYSHYDKQIPAISLVGDCNDGDYSELQQRL